MQRPARTARGAALVGLLASVPPSGCGSGAADGAPEPLRPVAHANSGGGEAGGSGGATVGG